MINAYGCERQTPRSVAQRSQVAAVFSHRPAGSGVLLRKLQRGEALSMPHARPMPSIGPRCYELRVHDAHKTWRIIYRLDQDAIVICEVFEKKTHRTPKSVIDVCQQRLRRYGTDAE